HDAQLLVAGETDQPVDCNLADLPARNVDDPRKAHRVRRIGEDPQVGEQVLHLAPLPELDPADQPVGYPAPDEDVLEAARLRVGPVEDREVSVLPPLATPQAV